MAKSICDTCCFGHLCSCPGGCDDYAPICENAEDALDKVIAEGRAEYWEAWNAYVNED